ncbi:hypothetical protein CPC08DRAFT_695015 [Agrocybe pediades]|nr:hypothetical protein CPC08DRAFT_695015 [Agrocybe pediades]
MEHQNMVAMLHDLFIDNCLHVFAISFLYYDHLITIGAEVEYIWKRPKGYSSYWFIANRYIPFFGNIAVTLLGYYVELPLESCKKYTLFRQLFLVFNQIFVCVLLTMRIYALYECSKRILAFTVACGLGLTGVASSTLFSEKRALTIAGGGCHIGLAAESSLRMAAAWEALFVYDSVIFTLTIYKTWQARRERALLGDNLPILYLILRDGAIYFAVMALCNLANISTFYVAGPFLRAALSTFSSAMSVTMMARLILNLHQSADEGIFTTKTTDTHMAYATASIGLDTDPGPDECSPQIPDIESASKQSKHELAIETGTEKSAMTSGQSN